MKLRPLFIILLVALGQSLALAGEDCQDVDVRDSLPAEVQSFIATPSSQGDLGWCFGWAATDLLSQAVGTPVSALHLSSYYSSTVTSLGKFARQLLWKQTIPEGGDMATAIDEMNDLGYVCREKDLPSQGMRIGLLVSQMKSYRAGTCNGVCISSLDALIKLSIPRFSPESVKEYLLTNPQATLEDALYVFLNSSCKDNAISLENKKIEYGTAYVTYGNNGKYAPSSKHTIIAPLDKALEQHRLVGLQYDANYIKYFGGFFGAIHDSVVVARKKIADQCYYLVKNSWGTSCDYLPGIICEKEQGSYWVKKSIMEQMSSKIIWIKQ